MSVSATHSLGDWLEAQQHSFCRNENSFNILCLSKKSLSHYHLEMSYYSEAVGENMMPMPLKHK